METCKVKLRKGANISYDILIGYGLLSRVPEIAGKITSANSFAIITDSKVAQIYGRKLLEGFGRRKMRSRMIIFPAGEKNKTRQTKEGIEDEMLGLALGRDTCVISLGGGITGDIAGFVASTYMRGVPYIHVPTSLLAMVDSSIGGKVGVNAKNAKNAIGAFYHPKKIIMDLDMLRSLPRSEISNGLAEIIKHGLIKDIDFFDFLEQNMEKILDLDEKTLMQAILRSCKIKISVMTKDENENGLRRVLNYGHTIGHAIESAMDYRLPHGHAIAIGMSCAARISIGKGHMDGDSAGRQDDLLLRAGLPVKLPQNGPNPEKIIVCLKNDKKIVDGRINFVLLDSIGKATISDRVSLDDIKKSVK